MILRARCHPVATLAICVSAVMAALAGCGSDEGSTTRGSTSQETSQAATQETNSTTVTADGSVGSSSVPESLSDLTGAIDDVGVGTKAYALSTALGADRYEIDGNTVHLYLGDGASLRGSAACIVTGSVLGEGEFAVIHDDGEEIACD